MWVLPLAAALVALVFAALLGRQYLDRRRPYQLLWVIALLMYAIASIALFAGVLSGWTTSAFRVYWLFGAVLTVPYLAMGEVYLLVKNRVVVNALLLLLVFASAFAVSRIRTAAIDPAALGSRLPSGKDAWAADPFVLHMAQIYAYPTYAFLVAGTLWSAWRMRSAPHLRE